MKMALALAEIHTVKIRNHAGQTLAGRHLQSMHIEITTPGLRDHMVGHLGLFGRVVPGKQEIRQWEYRVQTVTDEANMH